MDTVISKNASQEPAPALIYRDAYTQNLDEIKQVTSGELVPINVDIPFALTTALGAIPAIEAMRPRIVAEMPKFDLVRYDKV